MVIKPWGTSFNEAKSAIFLYLAFKGMDYPYHIHKFFKNSGLCKIDGLKTLNHPNKVSTLLREMKKDNLVLEKCNEESKNAISTRVHDRIFYSVNSNVIFLSSNYSLNDSEIQQLKDRDKEEWDKAINSIETFYSKAGGFNWAKDGTACPDCRERYLAMKCWQMKKDGKCWIRQVKEFPHLAEDENMHLSCDALSESTDTASADDATSTDDLQNNDSQYKETPLPALIYEYCEPDKVFPISSHDDDDEWSEKLFTDNYKLSDEEIKRVLSNIKKFDYLTILLVIRDLLHYIIFVGKMGSIDIGSADVKSAVRCKDIPSDAKKRQEFIEELIDWKIFFKSFSREYQINKIMLDIESQNKTKRNSPSVLFNFLTYDRIMSKDNTDLGIPHRLMDNEIYENLMVGINQLISKHLLDERIKEIGTGHSDKRNNLV